MKFLSLGIIILTLSATPVFAADKAQEMMEAKQKVAEEMNKKVPIKIDPITTLVSVEATAQGLTYHTRLSVPADQIPDVEEVTEQVKPELAKGLCRQSAAKKIMKEFDQVFTYDYQDENGQPIMAIQITKNDCL